MKDSQPVLAFVGCDTKYIKANNERFSTQMTAYNNWR